MKLLRFFRLSYAMRFYIPSSGKTFHSKHSPDILRPATRLRVVSKGRFF